MRSADLTDLTLETNTVLGHYDVINITDYIQHACMYMHAKTSHNSTFCTCTVSSCGHQLSIRCYNIDILMDSWNEPFQQSLVLSYPLLPKPEQGNLLVHFPPFLWAHLQYHTLPNHHTHYLQYNGSQSRLLVVSLCPPCQSPHHAKI